ncbi:pyridoxine 5'-phosphate synthase [Lewinellaceae bacterium SD302]|nr:pyridoxine 5'-phosphate synthase [Lewinellaceae bacterium SD302]
MTNLSVNLNKVALIRNSRGADYPNLVQVARDCEAFGAQGITVHPRPDERHARYADLPALKEIVTTEFNVEGYPSERFIREVLAVKPHQCTLVPDKPGQLTSDHGWDTTGDADLLRPIIEELKAAGIRVSLFVDPDHEKIEGAASVGSDRVEFYTGPYAHGFKADKAAAVAPFAQAAEWVQSSGMGLNAGHDLNLDNLRYFQENVPNLLEVSIGHALVSDALYYGLSNTIQLYLKCLD